MVLIQTTSFAPTAASATTAVFGDGPNGDYRIGLGEIPGNELLSAGMFLEWYFETPGGGGSFGEASPHNARTGGHAELTGGARLDALAATVTLLTAAATANMTGGALAAAFVTEDVLEGVTLLLGTSKIDVLFPGDITAASFLFGGVTETRFPELSANARAEANDGIKPCLPILILIDNVSHIGNLHEPDGVTPKLALTEAFRMSSTYSAPAGDALAALGASANDIGMRVSVDLQGDGILEETNLFRRPLDGEVVVMLDQTVERFNATLNTWEPHTSLPQRALVGMRAFEILDPDGIWDYYAKIVGLKYAQLARDTRDILDFIDPNLCPTDELPLLAENFGVDLSADATERTQRELIRQWIPLMQLKGLPQGIVIALRTLGFSGYATQIWTRIGASATEFIERPFGYSNELPDTTDPLTFYPAPQVAIHLNSLDGTPLVVIDDITKELVATFLKRNMLPAHVQIRTFVTDIEVGDDSLTATDAVTVVADTRTALVLVRAETATTTAVVSVLPNKATATVQAQTATTSISVTVTAP